MTEKIEVTLQHSRGMTFIREIDKVEEIMGEDTLDKLINILQELDIWARKNDVCIRLVGDNQ